MKFFDIFTITLFATSAIARPQDNDGSESTDGVEEDKLHGWCQCVIRGRSPAVINGDATSKACLAWEKQSGITATYDPVEVRCFTITSRIPGAAFQKVCASEGNFDSKCS